MAMGSVSLHLHILYVRRPRAPITTQYQCIGLMPASPVVHVTNLTMLGPWNSQHQNAFRHSGKQVFRQRHVSGELRLDFQPPWFRVSLSNNTVRHTNIVGYVEWSRYKRQPPMARSVCMWSLRFVFVTLPSRYFTFSALQTAGP